MKKTHWLYLIPALLIALNVMILPKLLASAQAIPEGKVVVEQRSQSSTERIPLPVLPLGYGESPIPRFSRELSAEEQQVWQQIPTDLKDVEWINDSVPARITLTERAFDRLKTASTYEMADPERELRMITEQYPVAKDDSKPGDIVIDIGSATMVLGEQPLDLKLAGTFGRSVYKDMSYGDRQKTEVEFVFQIMYSDFDWMESGGNGYYHMTRSLNENERSRFSYAQTRYLFEGLRPSGALLTTEPEDDYMWYDEANRTIHMPSKFELSDDELLRLHELQEMLTAQALGGKDVLFSENEAIQKAREWAVDIFGLSTDQMTSIVTLWRDTYFTAGQTTPIWRVQLGPENLLIMEDQSLGYDGCEIILSAVDGTFISAYLSQLEQDDLDTKSTGTREAQWKQAASDAVSRLFLNGKEPAEIALVSESYGPDPEALDGEWSERFLTSTDWAIKGSGKAVYHVEVAAVDGRITAIRYYPDGTQNLG